MVMDSNEIDKFLDRLMSEIYQISMDRREGGCMEDLIKLKKHIDKNIKNIINNPTVKGKITGAATGFQRLDELTGGFKPGELIILGGRPSMGKTAFASSLVLNLAKTTKLPIVYFSPGLSAAAMVMRLLSPESKVTMRKIRSGNFDVKDKEKLKKSARVLSGLPVLIDDTPCLTVLEISRKLRSLRVKGEIRMVIIDTLQLISGAEKEKDIPDIVRALKGLAVELGVPVLVLSELSRKLEERDNPRPRLGDFWPGSKMYRHIDTILFLYRMAYYNRDLKNPNDAEIIIARQRLGPTGMIKLTFRPEFASFENLAVK